DWVPPVETNTVNRAGDLWTLGDHQLLCGDALDPKAYSQLLGSDKARLVFTDPPYNVRIDGHVGGLGTIKHREFAMASGEMTKAEFTQFLETIFRNMADVSLDGAIHFVCMDWRHMEEVIGASH